MRTLSMINLIGVVLTVYCLSSCYPEKNPENDSVKIVLRQADQPPSKSAGISDNINNLEIFLYNSEENLLIHKSFKSITGIELRPPKGHITLVAIANVQGIDPSQFSTLSMARESGTTCSTGSGNYPVYTGEATFFNNGGGVEVVVELNTLTAKITFVFDKSRLDADVSINIRSIELMNVPLWCSFLSANKAGEGNPVGQGESIFSNTEPPSHNSATPLYMFENLKGTIPGLNEQSDKKPHTQENLYTYAVITTEYASQSKQGEVKFIYYPGENTTDNFNIPRGAHLRETIFFEGSSISESSQRVNISMLNTRSYTITALSDPPDGGITGGEGLYEYGSIPTLTAVANPGFKFIEWQPSLGTVSQNKNYTAKFEQLTQIISPSKISLDFNHINICIGNQFKLSENIEPYNVTEKMAIWSSTNNLVATVNQNGLVTGNSCGETQIKVTTSDGLLSDECTVRVYKKVEVYADKHINYIYDQTSGQITSASMVVYLRVLLPVPSDMEIVRAILPIVTVSGICSYNNNGFNHEEQITLSLSFSNNNDTPWLFTEGESQVIYFNSGNDEEILQNLDSVQIIINPGEVYSGNYYIYWN
ncbi:MAG: hypothetical protein A2X19_05935 [Bacteroidetes bacterium GWE2_39_28]|nr:MAG: hypothetical protein A2X19_05935 [Bacteroidetes bacterium GWE2_39_28]OFY12785.1 MAG: hypothetical protein A2X16_00715 [Bacteroidetes bacterium GWF2_39_10]OFZ07991.1 MAG: hypothetical protein A2322_07755 [Bacteroidetes bacterium RIFOXYB2_FULL_39_7]OFZ11010.1 MAG: hypothetical protein A2465_00745 [Bacteroidetes bacterium RIFOXYC2_FULL_39_11]HCT93739.1 hypothetical protein [Rikenellaceae bacterium]